MRSSYYNNNYPRQEGYGWRTTFPDYNAYRTGNDSSPAVLTDTPQNPDIPRYPNAHKLYLLNKFTTNEARETPPPEPTQPHHHNKKVHMAEKVEVIEATETGKATEKCVVREDSIDEVADGYIQQKHKNFELSKWMTFKKD